MDNVIKATASRIKQLFSLLSGQSNSSAQGTYNNVTSPLINVGQYSPAELAQMLPQSTTSNKNIKVNELQAYLSDQSRQSLNIIKEIKSLKALAPEIEESKRIYVSSIMSPNDMQDNSVNVTVDLDELPDDLNETISLLLNDFFNTKLEFGVKLTKWLGECFYETGSKAVVVLPRSNNRLLLATDTKLSVANERLTPSLLSPIVTLDNLPELGLSSISTESLIASCLLEASSIYEQATELLIGTEEFKSIPKQKQSPIIKSITDNVNSLLSNQQNYIIVSNNPDILRSNNTTKQTTKDKLQKQLDDHFFGDNNQQAMIIDDSTILNSDAYPSIIEFPSESVIPVCVPGSPNEHLGYFVIVDNWGNPIDQATMDSNPVSLTERASNAMYGNNSMVNSLSKGQREKTFETVFNLTIKNLISHKLKASGIDSFNVLQSNSINNCIFQRLLKKQKVGLIFIPESLMIYYRFDHRPDGTGKSMIEDVSFILSLRATLMIAQTMATIKEAVPKTILEVDIDEKNANIEQTLDMVRRIYTEKQTLRFKHDPNTIARDLTNNSLTLIPKGLAGLPNNLSSTSDSKSTSVNKPDTSLIENYTNMARPGFGVPPSALNQLNETEFSRSIVTQNLFYSNVIRDRQRVVSKFNNKLIRTYVKYSNNLRESLLALLSTYIETIKKADNKPKDEFDITELDINTLLNQVMSSIKVSLPSPAVSTNKAQYEEIQQHIDMIDRILETLLNDNLLTDSSTKELLTNVRALTKAKLIRSFLTTVGFQGNFDIPSIETAIENGSDLPTITKALINLKKGLSDTISVLSEEESSSY